MTNQPAYKKEKINGHWTLLILMEDGKYYTLTQLAFKYKLNRCLLERRFHQEKLRGKALVQPPLTLSQIAKRSRLKALERGKEFRINPEKADKVTEDPEFRKKIICKLKREGKVIE